MEPIGGSPRVGRNSRTRHLPVGGQLIIPPPVRRVQTRDYLPASIKNWATNIIDFLPERDHLQVLTSSIVLGYQEAMHNQVLITNTADAAVFPMVQRATLVDDLSVINLLPQYVSGANVGTDENNFIVIGPYNALYAKGETDPIENHKFADQLYVNNYDFLASHTIICQVRVRFFLDTGGSGS